MIKANNLVDRIGIVILNYNDVKTTISLVDKIMSYKSISNIVIVDNHSTDNSADMLNSRYESVAKIKIIISNKNGVYGEGNNIGIKYLYNICGVRYQIVCNPDVSFEEDIVFALQQGLKSLSNAAVVAPLMLDRDRKLNNRCVWKIPNVWEYIFFSLGVFSGVAKSFYYAPTRFDEIEPWEVGCVAGSMFMMDVERLGTTEPYDEKIFLYCEETVLGIKTIEAGYKSYIIPGSYFCHLHSVSINKSFPKEIKRYKLMWDSRLYVLKTYMKASFFQLLCAKISKAVFLIEKRVKFAIKKEG